MIHLRPSEKIWSAASAAAASAAKLAALAAFAFTSVAATPAAAGAAEACTACGAATCAAAPAAKARHVVLIGLDGFGGYAWEKAEMPRLKALAKNGALTLKARPVIPSVSRPNWATHLMGAGPELHGWTANIPKPTPEPLVTNARGLFPGIFPLVRETSPQAKTAAFYDWNSIHDIIDAATITHEIYVAHGGNSVTRYANPAEVKRSPKPPSATLPPAPKTAPKPAPAPAAKPAAAAPAALSNAKKTQPAKRERTPEELEHIVALYELSSIEVGKAAAEYIAKEKPVFSFVYFGAADETGHMIGHDTPRYYETLRKLDGAIGGVLDALQTAGIADDTAVIIVSDHGGINKGHGGKTLLEMQTPWIIAGAGVRGGVLLKDTVVHTDTAPTIARLLGLPEPQPWRGKAVVEALKK